MNEDELNAIVDAELAKRLEAELQARRERVRQEVVLQLRREAERAHHAKINARHPIETRLGGLTEEQEAERLRIIDERSRAAREHLDRVNSRPTPGAAVRGLRPKRSDSAGGGSGFVIK
jgi:hypothetical protein